MNVWDARKLLLALWKPGFFMNQYGSKSELPAFSEFQQNL
jgi:hypothetical protein